MPTAMMMTTAAWAIGHRRARTQTPRPDDYNDMIMMMVTPMNLMYLVPVV